MKNNLFQNSNKSRSLTFSKIQKCTALFALLPSLAIPTLSNISFAKGPYKALTCDEIRSQQRTTWKIKSAGMGASVLIVPALGIPISAVLMVTDKSASSVSRTSPIEYYFQVPKLLKAATILEYSKENPMETRKFKTAMNEVDHFYKTYILAHSDTTYISFDEVVSFLVNLNYKGHARGLCNSLKSRQIIANKVLGKDQKQTHFLETNHDQMGLMESVD